MEENGKCLQALRAALPRTLPVFAGYVPLGLAYGIYMRSLGFGILYPAGMAVIIYGGSLEFVAGALLTAPFAPAAAFMMALMIQARHLFYGISMLEKYRGVGWKKLYLIYAMSDETFSVVYSSTPPDGVDRGWYMFFISLLDQSYWVLGATLGGLLGAVLPFNTEGIDFVMTAMFVVIFMDQWKKEKQHISALVGLAAPVCCLLLFGADSFLLPAMGCILLLLTALRRPIERRAAEPLQEGGERQ